MLLLSASTYTACHQQSCMQTLWKPLWIVHLGLQTTHDSLLLHKIRCMHENCIPDWAVHTCAEPWTCCRPRLTLVYRTVCTEITPDHTDSVGSNVMQPVQFKLLADYACICSAWLKPFIHTARAWHPTRCSGLYPYQVAVSVSTCTFFWLSSAQTGKLITDSVQQDSTSMDYDTPQHLICEQQHVQGV